MSVSKEEILTCLVVVGRACRSERVQFNVPGNELQVINHALDKLQDFINDLNGDLIEIRDVEIPEADVEEMVDENPAD